MKRLPFLTPAQRRGLLVLEWVLLLGLVAVAVWKSKTPKPRTPQPLLGRETRMREWNGTPLQQITYAVEETPVETFPFDPNTADSTTLLRLGLAPRQVRAVYRYRARLGRYHTPEDFQYLPGMTVEQWERLKDFIRIAPEFRYLDPKPRKSFQEEATREQVTTETTDVKCDSFPRQEKIKFGQTIDINIADTAQLKMIPGIASKRAAKIVAYRNKLGGFVSAEQAMEATEMPDSVLRYMTVSAIPVTKINVNNLSVQQMMKHPYLNFYQAKAINEYRRNKGELHSIEELSRLEGFKPTDIDRLRPYVEF